VALGGPVLAATDLGEAADAALRQGHAIASEIGASLLVCHVLPEAFRVRVLFPQDAGIDWSADAALERKARNAVRARMDSVLGTFDPPLEVAIEWGTAHSGILTAAERIGAGLIVVGPGATAQRVARSSNSPVLVARPSPTGGIILGATDFSDPSLPAVRMAPSEAKRRGVALCLLHCLEVDETPRLITASLPGMIAIPPLPPDSVERLETAARERLDEALASSGVAGQTFVLRRPPPAGIVERAETPATSLIVIGTRGRTGIARLGMGNVAEDAVARAPCSVLVVPLNRDV
jgi:nucleotide-binding universal stress UspA family protein